MNNYETLSLGEKIIALQYHCNKVPSRICKSETCIVSAVKELAKDNSAVKNCDFKRSDYPVDLIEIGFELLQYSQYFNLDEVKKILSERK